MKLSDYCFVTKEQDREITEDELNELMLKAKDAMTGMKPEAQSPFNAEDMEKLIESVKRLNWDR